jgi:hypothetical protein
MSKLARIKYVCKQGKRRELINLGLVIRTKWLTKDEPSICEGGYGCRPTEHYSTATYINCYAHQQKLVDV